MKFTFGATDIVVDFEPVKPGRGRRPMTRRVYARYGNVQSRLVQEICDAVAAGGSCVYVSVNSETVAVHSWKRVDEYNNLLPAVANILYNAADRGLETVVYGADRAKWRLAIRNERHSSARDALDAEPDNAGDPASDKGQATIREEF